MLRLSVAFLFFVFLPSGSALAIGDCTKKVTSKPGSIQVVTRVRNHCKKVHKARKADTSRKVVSVVRFGSVSIEELGAE